MPSGTIVDQNSDENSVDTWALVTDTVVSNLAAGDLAYAQLVQNSYDYIVDITVGGQTVNIGDIYDSETDTFSPPPNPYIETTKNDIISIELV